MSHLSPFSYVSRVYLNALVLLAILVHLTKIGGWRKINLLNPKRRNVRTGVVWCTLASAVCIFVYDCLNIRLKYTEGYEILSFDAEDSSVVEVKPATPATFTDGNLQLLEVSGGFLNAAFTLKSSGHFLALAFWASIAKTTFGVSAFGESWEFRAYTVYSVLSVVLYPIMQYSFTDDLLSIIMPQMLYHVECIAVVLLNLLVIRRLRTQVQVNNLSGELQHRLNFYVSMNKVQVFFVLMDAVSLAAINVDILSGANSIAESPFWTDLLTNGFSFGLLISELVTIMTMMPPSLARLTSNSGISRRSTHTGRPSAMSHRASNSVMKFGKQSTKVMSSFGGSPAPKQ